MSETRILASYVTDTRLDDIPEDVRHEARRAIVNYVGCAVGGSIPFSRKYIAAEL